MLEIGPWEIFFRLLLSAVSAGLIGMERESHGRPAGLRTHMLVGLGSCLMMLISIYGDAAQNRDPLRLAAQVVSGIGFLGAGTILRSGLTIKGLTTAASLWVVAGIGLAMGCGLYFPGLIAVIFAVLTLISLENIERRLFNEKTLNFSIVFDANAHPDLLEFCSRIGVVIKQLKLEINPKQQLLNYEVLVESKDVKPEYFISELSKIDGVKSLKWE
ncbi:MAG TPA: MgtC/SapB family protein [Bacillota bacterium]